jgi:hypothetical protein
MLLLFVTWAPIEYDERPTVELDANNATKIHTNNVFDYTQPLPHYLYLPLTLSHSLSSLPLSLTLS